MKNSHLIATAAALTGFATGWLLKPSGESGKDEASAPEAAGGRPAAVASGKSQVRDDRPLILKARGGSELEVKADPELASAEVAFQRSFGSATERAENARLSRLSEALGLSPEQRETVDVLLANRRDGFRELNGGGKSASEMVALAAQAERRFEEQIAKILDPEQTEAFVAFRDREKENAIEAKAQRDLADLIGQIDLSADQRELALEALRASSSEAQARRPPGWTLMNESMSLLGGAHSLVLDDMGEFMGDDEVMGDSQAFHQHLSRSKRAAMETNLSRLATVLTPAQLAQYRANLEARVHFVEQFTPPKFEQR
jgi:hypothetical protein